MYIYPWMLQTSPCFLLLLSYLSRVWPHIYIPTDASDLTLLPDAVKSLPAAVKLLQCDPIDGSPPGYPVPGILQARTLEWVAISFSKAWKWKVKVKLLNHVRLLATPWTAAYQAPPSMGFSRQEYWSRVPLPSPTLLPTALQMENKLLNGALNKVLYLFILHL